MATVVSIDRRKTCSELEALTEEVRTLHTSYVLHHNACVCVVSKGDAGSGERSCDQRC